MNLSYFKPGDQVVTESDVEDIAIYYEINWHWYAKNFLFRKYEVGLVLAVNEDRYQVNHILLLSNSGIGWSVEMNFKHI